MRMHVQNRCFAVCCVSAFLALGFSLRAASVDENLRAIKSVGAEGKGHAAAIVAVKELANAPVESLPLLLKSFEGASPLAVNWLRSTVDTVADRALKKTGKLPAAALESFVKDTDRSPEARRLAYEWLIKVDATASDRLIPGMLNDASPRQGPRSRKNRQAESKTGLRSFVMSLSAMLPILKSDQKFG